MLIVGCGQLGLQVAQQLAAANEPVAGVVRSPESLNKLESAGIAAQRMDLDQTPLPRVAAAGDGLFYFAPPPSSGSRDPRMQNLLHSLAEHGELPRRIVYISTTGVYGDCDGEWVDEFRPIAPGVDRARRRAHAEHSLRTWCDEQEVEWVILRVAGIYGPQRLPLERLKAGLPLVNADESPYTNRIHEDDLAQVCLAAMEKPIANGEIFNVSDGDPGKMADYFDAIAARTGLPPPPKISMQEAAEKLSPGMLSYMRESRRLDNRKMLKLLDKELRYPTLAEGLDDCFSATS